MSVMYFIYSIYSIFYFMFHDIYIYIAIQNVESVESQYLIKLLQNKTMSEPEHENHDNSEDKKAYGCPCGKKYLSYPALFTHVRHKHDGTAPGELIKPKTNKTRGRPKIHTEVPEQQLCEIPFDLEKQIFPALPPTKNTYDEKFQCAKQTKKNCQSMLTHFLKSLPSPLLQSSEPEQYQKYRLSTLNCFCNYIKHYTIEKRGEKYWNQQKPSQLVDLINQFCHDFDQYSEKFPLTKDRLVNLLFFLFRWMYKEKWSDHKIIKRQEKKEE